MIVSASVLLPEPLGPMIACTSPARTTRSMPRRIGLPSTATCRSLISRSGTRHLLACHRCVREHVERPAVERLRDARLQRHPHVMRRAAGLQRAVLDRVTLGGADLWLDRTFERTHDVARGDRTWIARERVSAARAALALHQPGLAQARNELLEIRLRQLLARRHGVQTHRAFAPVTSEVDHKAHAVFAACGHMESGLRSNSEHFTRYSSRPTIGA